MEEVKATLIFNNSSKDWLRRSLKEGFSHVRVVIHKPNGYILIDPRTAITTLECYAKSDILIRAEGETHVFVRRMIDPTKYRRFFGPLNCVEIVKGALGISKPFIFTPYQLYKEVKNNAQT